MFGNRSMILRSLLALGIAFIGTAWAIQAQSPEAISPPADRNPVVSSWKDRNAPPPPTSCGGCAPFLGCPDDYTCKPFPRIWRLPCGGPDDYCPKPFPRVWHLPCGGPDDYCRKPMPMIDRPLRSDYYRCVNAPDGCSVPPASPGSPCLSSPR